MASRNSDFIFEFGEERPLRDRVEQEVVRLFRLSTPRALPADSVVYGLP